MGVSAVRMLFLLSAPLCCASPLHAHPAPFSYLDVHVGDEGISGRLVVHAIDAAHELQLASPDPLGESRVLQRYATPLMTVLNDRLILFADGERLAWTATGARPLPEQTAIEIHWRAQASRMPGRLTIQAALFPYDPNHQTFVSIYEGSPLVRQDVLNRERTAFDFYTGTSQGRWAVFTTFTSSGIHHIAIGPDHILFIVGLLLLGGSLSRLLAIVTAFTVGHSVTLALAALNVVDPPSSVVEPAIALSIVYVGADNLLVGQRGRDVRAWIALFFGLVHGFGFARVLRDTGLPNRALGLSLFGFNLGVEIGQAAIVIAVASALFVLRGLNAPLAARLATAGSVGVMLAGVFWFVERLV
jgi:hydrogenase/urease accessory protein HupE